MSFKKSQSAASYWKPLHMFRKLAVGSGAPCFTFYILVDSDGTQFYAMSGSRHQTDLVIEQWLYLWLRKYVLFDKIFLVWQIKHLLVKIYSYISFKVPFFYFQALIYDQKWLAVNIKCSNYHGISDSEVRNYIFIRTFDKQQIYWDNDKCWKVFQK